MVCPGDPPYTESPDYGTVRVAHGPKWKKAEGGISDDNPVLIWIWSGARLCHHNRRKTHGVTVNGKHPAMVGRRYLFHNDVNISVRGMLQTKPDMVGLQVPLGVAGASHG